MSSFDTLSTERAADLDAITAMLLLGSAGLASNAELRDDLGRIKKSMPGAPVLVITDEFDWDDVSVAMQLGAKGYLASSVSVDLLIQCLRLLMIGGTAFPAVVSTSTASHTSESPPPPQSRPENNLAIDLFTSREIEVLASLGEGKPNKIIAYELNICETTVKVHMRHIMRKLGAANRTQAALLASEMVRA